MMRPPARTVDEVNVRHPRFYADPGEAGWYPELQHPVRKRLTVKWHTGLGRDIYIFDHEIMLFHLSEPVRAKDLRDDFAPFGVASVRLLAPSRNRFYSRSAIISFDLAEDASRALNQAIAWYDQGRYVKCPAHVEINTAGRNRWTTTDILLVKEGSWKRVTDRPVTPTPPVAEVPSSFAGHSNPAADPRKRPRETTSAEQQTIHIFHPAMDRRPEEGQIPSKRQAVSSPDGRQPAAIPVDSYREHQSSSSNSTAPDTQASTVGSPITTETLSLKRSRCPSPSPHVNMSQNERHPEFKTPPLSPTVAPTDYMPSFTLPLPPPPVQQVTPPPSEYTSSRAGSNVSADYVEDFRNWSGHMQLSGDPTVHSVGLPRHPKFFTITNDGNLVLAEREDQIKPEQGPPISLWDLTQGQMAALGLEEVRGFRWKVTGRTRELWKANEGVCAFFPFRKE